MLRKTAVLLLLGGACAEVPPATGTVTQGLCKSEDQGGEGCCPGSPILIDMAGDGLHLTSTEDGVLYQLHPGRLGHWAWTSFGSDDAFLALDRDDNGSIDDGSELFGDGATQVAGPEGPNGFAALAYFDRTDQGGNDDGVIDARDAVWMRLRLWTDVDHDAWSAPDELRPVAASGIRGFVLQPMPSTHVDQFGNEFRFNAPIVADAPIGRVASDVWLVQSPIVPDAKGDGPRPPGIQTDFLWTCTAWYYSIERIGNPDLSTIECLSPLVNHDPVIVMNPDPELYRSVRRVARTSSALNNFGRALIGASDAVLHDTTTCDNRWYWSYSLDRDPFKPLPYDQGIGDVPRAKCYSTRIGGGGCGG